MIFKLYHYPGFTGYTRKVTTRSEEAQTWFDQGIQLLSGFNRDEAIRSFEKAAEIDQDFDFHACRKQFITDLVDAGVTPKVAQRLARHSTVVLTMDRYTHPEDDQVTGRWAVCRRHYPHAK